MNISLRKANAIQLAINDAIKGIQTVTSVELNEFQDVEQELQRANTALFQADARRQKLLITLYNIRGLVGAANAQNGIDLNLAKAAFIDKRIAQIEAIAGQEAMVSLDVLKGKLEKIRSRPADSRATIYGRDDTVTTSVITQEQINQAKAEILSLRKQKQKLNDEILELNIKTEIPLSDEIVQTLQAEGLI